MQVHFEHRRSSRTEAVWTGLTTFVPLVAALTALFVWTDPTTEPIAFIFASSLLVVGILILSYVVRNWHANGDFVFRIDETGVEQIVPDSNCGESFRIPEQDLRHAMFFVSDGEHLTLVGNDGSFHEVAYNYGNPLDRIVATLKSLDVPVYYQMMAEDEAILRKQNAPEYE